MTRPPKPAPPKRRRQPVSLSLAPDVVAILRGMPGEASRLVDEAVRALIATRERVKRKEKR